MYMDCACRCTHVYIGFRRSRACQRLASQPMVSAYVSSGNVVFADDEVPKIGTASNCAKHAHQTFCLLLQLSGNLRVVQQSIGQDTADADCRRISDELVFHATSAMQRSHRLLHVLARLDCAQGVYAQSALPHTILAGQSSFFNWLRSITSLSQLPAGSRQQQDCFKQLQQHQRPPPPCFLPYQQQRQLFGIGESNDTHKDYKERRLIGYVTLLWLCNQSLLCCQSCRNH